MDIRVYDFDFKLLCIMSDAISSSWTIRYNGIGTYEGHFRLRDKVAQIILKEPYIVITEGEKQAVCTAKVAESELLVCGRTVNWLLSKRVIPPFKSRTVFGDTFKGAKEIAEYVLQRTFTAPPKIDEGGCYLENTVDDNRKVGNFTLPSVEGDTTLDRYFWRNSANTADEVIADLCELAGLGHRLYFNVVDKTWDFEFLEGEEKPIILSEHNRNLYDASYTEDIEKLASGGWYEIYSSAASGTDSDGSGADEDETVWRYLKKESDLTGMKYWEAKFSESGLSQAQSAMEKRIKECTLQGTVSGLKYLKDYNLGDTVSAYMRFGNFEKKVKYKIVGINIWYNSDSSGEEPILKQVPLNSSVSPVTQEA